MSELGGSLMFSFTSLSETIRKSIIVVIFIRPKGGVECCHSKEENSLMTVSLLFLLLLLATFCVSSLALLAALMSVSVGQLLGLPDEE